MANEKRIAELQAKEAVRRAEVAAELEAAKTQDMVKREEDERGSYKTTDEEARKGKRRSSEKIEGRH